MTTILGISGSLRTGSFNTALLRASAELLTEQGVSFEFAEIGDLPLFNSDLGTIDAVERLKSQITAADGVLIACPEYNHGIPGPLKNAIDWASRPAMKSPFAHKPVGVVGAAPGIVGTARVQGHLKLVLMGMLAHPFPWPELLVGQAKTRFTDGELTDATTREYLARYMTGFVEFVAK